MPDISTELAIIESAELGNDVRIAVASAAEKLSEDRTADISSELRAIQNGRYGYAIREAIHNALYKLAQSTPEPSEGGAQVGIAVPVLYGTAMTRVGIATTQYPLPPAIIEVTQGQYITPQNVGEPVTILWNDTRCRTITPYRIPAGKKLTISCSEQNVMIAGCQIDEDRGYISMLWDGWQNFPRVVDNTQEDTDLILCIHFRKSDNSNCVPSDFGSITAVLE